MLFEDDLRTFLLNISDYVLLKDGNNEIELELEADGTLSMSSLQAVCGSKATGLTYTAESGRERGIRVSDGKLFPPKGKWGGKAYSVYRVTQEQDVKNNTDSAKPQMCCETTSHTKQKTIVIDGSGIKLGPEVNVSVKVLFLSLANNIFMYTWCSDV